MKHNDHKQGAMNRLHPNSRSTNMAFEKWRFVIAGLILKNINVVRTTKQYCTAPNRKPWLKDNLLEAILEIGQMMQGIVKTQSATYSKRWEN